MNKIYFIILSTVIVICSSFLIHQTFAQETTTDPPIADPTTAAVSAIGLAGAGTALLTSVLNDRKQKKNVKGTDVDTTMVFIILSKIFQVAYEVDPKWKQILDTKATSNKIDKTTLGESFTSEVDGWTTFVQEAYHVARPSMSMGTPANTTQKPTETKPADTNPK